MLLSIEIFRVVAMFSIVLLHCGAIYNSAVFLNKSNLAFWSISQLLRFAVPCFFAISGYFLAIKVSRVGYKYALIKYVKKILKIFVVWSILYTILPNGLVCNDYFTFLCEKLKIIISNPILFLLQGGCVHLWFLSSLIQITIFALFVNFQTKFKLVLVFSMILYFIGVIGGGYANTSYGVSLGFNTRNGLFMGLLPFLIGYYLSQSKISINYLILSLCILSGILCQFLEAFYLSNFGVLNTDYVFSTILWSMGVFILVLKFNKYISTSVVSSAGRYMLGVYLMHYFLIDKLIKSGYSTEKYSLVLLCAFVIFIISLLTTYFINRTFLKHIIN